MSILFATSAALVQLSSHFSRCLSWSSQWGKEDFLLMRWRTKIGIDGMSAKAYLFNFSIQSYCPRAEISNVLSTIIRSIEPRRKVKSRTCRWPPQLLKVTVIWLRLVNIDRKMPYCSWMPVVILHFTSFRSLLSLSGTLSIKSESNRIFSTSVKSFSRMIRRVVRKHWN